MKAARKSLGVRQRQARALRFKGDIADLDSPPSGVCLVHLLKACRRDELGLRDAALLRVAYDAGCRRSELVAILVQHIEKDAQGAGTLFLPSSKTDQAGEGAWAYLRSEEHTSELQSLMRISYAVFCLKKKKKKRIKHSAN